MGFYENISPENKDAFTEHLAELQKEGNVLTDKQVFMADILMNDLYLTHQQ